jgi:hypothetical protein
VFRCERVAVVFPRGRLVGFGFEVNVGSLWGTLGVEVEWLVCEAFWGCVYACMRGRVAFCMNVLLCVLMFLRKCVQVVLLPVWSAGAGARSGWVGVRVGSAGVGREGGSGCPVLFCCVWLGRVYGRFSLPGDSEIPYRVHLTLFPFLWYD